MYTLWLVSEDPALPATLAHHLASLGQVPTGPLETSRWKEADAPDLIVLAAVDAPPHGDRQREELAALERILGFLRAAPPPRRPPPPLLYIQAPAGGPPAALVRSLIDDRRVHALPWPLDPAQLLEQAAALLVPPGLLPSLRERARRDWVTRRVELLYAELDLPRLRQAIDPRNAARPVLLAGEPGTGRGLLARYIHNLAEPPREDFISVAVAGLRPTEVESRVLARCLGGRSTLYLRALDRAEPLVQEELAGLLAESGALGLEPIRWIASVGRSGTLVPGLRLLPWIRVELPPLRARTDLEELARALVREWSEENRRPITLGEGTSDALASYVWPGNLNELESVLDASLAAASGSELTRWDLVFTPELAAAHPEQRAAEPSGEEREAAPVEAEPGPEAGEPARTPSGAEGEDTEPEPAGPEPPEAPAAPVGGPHEPLALEEILAPLADEIRQPLLAIRTYASLLDQRPGDPEVKRGLASLVEGDLARVERLLQRLERFASFLPPQLAPVDLPGLLLSELEARQAEIRDRSLVVLRELDHAAPPALADEVQLRFALGSLLDRALRMIPPGGDLYLGSLHREARGDASAGHRVMLRFHSPEEVLVGPPDLPGPGSPVEVILAQALIERMGGVFAIDASGSQDNLILIELPV